MAKVGRRSAAKWERWEKDRTFVRSVVGKYAEVFRDLQKQPRVYKSQHARYKGGPTKWSKNVINPEVTRITQAIETHIDILAPGSHGQRHAHMNSAVFYILDGRGHDIHDGVRYDWEAGDVCIVENGCVHQHFNDDPERPAHILIVKAKPLFAFFNVLMQGVVEFPPQVARPGFENFDPERAFNHR
ncbi:MAG: cupin domain-containing protein [Candidatus Binatia bacterium]